MIRMVDGKRETLFEKLITDFPHTSEPWLTLEVQYWISYDKKVTFYLRWRGLGPIAELGPLTLH